MKTRSEISASSINPTGSINTHESLIETTRENLEKDNLLTRYFPMERVNRDSRIHEYATWIFVYNPPFCKRLCVIAVNQNIPYSSGKHQFVKDI